MDLSTERIIQCLEKLGNPQNTFKTIHVTGTNGKGSVCAYLSTFLESVRTTWPTKSRQDFLASLGRSSEKEFVHARLTSPHLIEPNECITINGVPVPASQYANAKLRAAAGYSVDGSQLTLFETFVVAAFLLFKLYEVDVAVVEVGMGGRRDATNVFLAEHVLCSVITAIDKDHVPMLGSSVAEIAVEKAHIIKENGICFYAPQPHSTAEEALLAYCSQHQVCYYTCGTAELVEPEVESYLNAMYTYSRQAGTRYLQPSHSLQIPDTLNFMFPTNRGPRHLENFLLSLEVIFFLHTALGLPALRMNTIAQLACATYWPGRLTLYQADVVNGEKIEFLRNESKSTPKSLLLSSPVPEDDQLCFPLLVDGAHNLASLSVLITAIHAQLRYMCAEAPSDVRIHLLLSFSKGEAEVREMLTELFIQLGASCLTVYPCEFQQPTEMPWVKPMQRDLLATLIRETLTERARHVVDTSAGDRLVDCLAAVVRRGIRLQEAGPCKQLVVLAGSLYFVGTFLRVIGTTPSDLYR